MECSSTVTNPIKIPVLKKLIFHISVLVCSSIGYLNRGFLDIRFKSPLLLP